jgi:hypothetical protein
MSAAAYVANDDEAPNIFAVEDRFFDRRSFGQEGLYGVRTDQGFGVLRQREFSADPRSRIRTLCFAASVFFDGDVIVYVAAIQRGVPGFFGFEAGMLLPMRERSRRIRRPANFRYLRNEAVRIRGYDFEVRKFASFDQQQQPKLPGNGRLDQ